MSFGAFLLLIFAQECFNNIINESDADEGKVAGDSKLDVQSNSYDSTSTSARLECFVNFIEREQNCLPTLQCQTYSEYVTAMRSLGLRLTCEMEREK